MKPSIVEYVLASGTIEVCPIGAQGTLFDFLTMGRLQITETLGFLSRQATGTLWTVAPGQAESDDLPDRRADWDGAPAVLDELQSLREAMAGSGVPFCGGGCFGPLTVVSEILGAETLLRTIVKNPAKVERLLDYAAEFLSFIARKETEAGQDLFWIAEPVASLLPPVKLWQFCGKWIRQVFEAAQVPGILHVCGKTDRHTQELLRTGAAMLSIDYLTDMEKCLSECGDAVPVMGNVSPMLLRDGTVEEVREGVRGLIEKCSAHPNFVLGTGCVLIGGTPEENLRVLFEEAGKVRKAVKFG